MRTRTVHRCEACGAGFPRWSGRCPTCGEWNTLVEERITPISAHPAATVLVPEVVPLAAVDAAGGSPVATGVAELDRAISGGLVPGSVTLISGEPGIGKSTLLLQAACAFAATTGRRCLIVAAEESAEQIRRRAERLGAVPDGVEVLETTSLEAILGACEHRPPDLLVVDSIQAIADPELSASGGSVTQVRECAARLVAYAKANRVATVLVGHVTKDGQLAGPRLLEHLVDTVLSFEGDRHHALRVLSVLKHRFGTSGELGIFSMTATGLEGVDDPSALLLADRCDGVSGSIVVPVLEGRRPLLAELQALVAPSPLATPRRTAEGLPSGRLALLLAVLERRAGIVFANADVFVSLVGGLRINEPAADLALGLALASAASGEPLGDDLVACGEIGLSGEVRQVAYTDRRLAEAARRGFRRAVVSPSAPEPPVGMSLVRAATLAEAIAECHPG